MNELSTITAHPGRLLDVILSGIGDARVGQARVAGLALARTRRLRVAERNAFELGRDHERGQRQD